MKNLLRHLTKRSVVVGHLVTRLRFGGVFLLALTLSLLAMPQVHAQQTVVANYMSGELMVLDLATGDRTLLSSAERGSGPMFGAPVGLARESSGSIVVSEDAGSATVYRIDVTTGDRTVVSSDTVGSGPSLNAVYGLAVEADGSILAVSYSDQVIYRIDPVSGDRVVLASPTVGSGAAMTTPFGLALDEDGSIVFTGATGLMDVIRMDKTTGVRTLISSSTPGTLVGTGPALSGPTAIVRQPDGSYLVLNFVGDDYLLKVDAVTGNRTLVSGVTLGTGPAIGYRYGFSVDENGGIYIMDFEGNAVVKVDPATGNRTILASNDVGAGPDFSNPLGILSGAVASISEPSKPEPVAQTIAVTAPSNKLANDATFSLSGTSTSELPLTWTVVSGPAMIDGTTVSLTGATGTVVIRADVAGNDAYLPSSETFSFEVTQVGPLVYFGQSSEGAEFAANIPEDSDEGTLLGRIAQTGEYFILTFRVNADRSITTSSVQILGGATSAAQAATSLAENPVRKRLASRPTWTGGEINSGATYTFTGTLLNGELRFTIAELNITLSGTVEPPTGPTVPLAGFYESSSLNSASGSISTIIGTSGNIYVLSVTQNLVADSKGTINGDGTFTVTTSDNAVIQGQVNSVATTLTGSITLAGGQVDNFAGLSAGTLRTDRLINLATRARVSASTAGGLTTGFVVGGTMSKQVLVRGIGPSLTAFGVEGAAADTQVRLLDSTGALLVANDNWGGADELTAAMARLGAFPLSGDSKDAAVLATLTPGVYTVQVTSGGESGIALAEIYDAAENPSSEYQRLINISSRGPVTAGDGVLIGSFVITGNSPKRVLVRGVGPALAAYGVTDALADPTLRIFASNGDVLAQNDNWETAVAISSAQQVATAAEIETANSSVGAFAFASGSADAAVVLTLQPGGYTAHVGSNNPNAGTALIEVYELP